MHSLRLAESNIVTTYFQDNRTTKRGLTDHIHPGLGRQTEIKQTLAHLAATIMAADTDTVAGFHLAQGHTTLLTGNLGAVPRIPVLILAFFIGAKKPHYVSPEARVEHLKKKND